MRYSLTSNLTIHVRDSLLQVNETSGINWSVEADKLLVSNMLIKMADINGPCKALELHLEWTSRIHEEFFEQVKDCIFPASMHPCIHSFFSLRVKLRDYEN